MHDYRQLEGRFDRIVSVGMFEHVGRPHYDAFFAKIAQLLAEDGVALVHSIGRAHGPYVMSPLIRKYIFPGSYIPALSEVLPSIEWAGLWVTDIGCCAGTMLAHCVPGTSGWSPIASGSKRSTTRASSECGSSTWSPPSSSSRTT